MWKTWHIDCTDVVSLHSRGAEGKSAQGGGQLPHLAYIWTKSFSNDILRAPSWDNDGVTIFTKYIIYVHDKKTSLAFTAKMVQCTIKVHRIYFVTKFMWIILVFLIIFSIMSPKQDIIKKLFPLSVWRTAIHTKNFFYKFDPFFWLLQIYLKWFKYAPFWPILAILAAYLNH